MTKIDIISTKSVGDVDEVFLPYYLGLSPQDAEETYLKFSKLMGIMANSYACNTNIDVEDYFADAITGLARARRDWDSSRGGCKFKTFAIMKIKNALNERYRKNKSIVKIPSYVRTAHTYITNIKTILEIHNIDSESIDHFLETNDFDNITSELPIGDLQRFMEEALKLDTLIKNIGVRRADLIARSEFVPSDMAYNEAMTQEELYDREKRRLSAALIVSKLEDHMTDSELHVAQGIMAGKSYAEIGRTHDPKRSIAWVQKKLEEMKTKFEKKMEGGL